MCGLLLSFEDESQKVNTNPCVTNTKLSYGKTFKGFDWFDTPVVENKWNEFFSEFIYILKWISCFENNSTQRALIQLLIRSS